MNPEHNISKVNKKAFDKVVATNLSDSADPSDLSRKYLRGGSMNDALRRGALEPEPKRLFGPLITEGEVSIVYATSKVGKTVLMYQCGDAWARGLNVFPNNSDLANDCSPKRVLYVDAELKLRQITKRYSEPYGKNIYHFSENFDRIGKEKGFKYQPGDNLPAVINENIGAKIESFNPEIIIIDNLSVLGSGIENSKEAMPLMLTLLNWNIERDITIVVIGHTTKQDPFTAIQKSHLQGSALIASMFESIVAFARCSGDEHQRYIKAIDFRSEKEAYGSSKVIVCKVEKPHNKLQWTFEGYKKEDDVLLEFNADAKAQTDKDIIQWYFEGYDQDTHPTIKRDQLLKIDDIVPMVAWGRTKVKELIKEAKENGKVKRSERSEESDRSATTTQSEQLKAI